MKEIDKGKKEIEHVVLIYQLVILISNITGSCLLLFILFFPLFKGLDFGVQWHPIWQINLVTSLARRSWLRKR